MDNLRERLINNMKFPSTKTTDRLRRFRFRPWWKPTTLKDRLRVANRIGEKRFMRGELPPGWPWRKLIEISNDAWLFVFGRPKYWTGRVDHAEMHDHFMNPEEIVREYEAQRK
jgi:hypothetical protein